MNDNETTTRMRRGMTAEGDRVPSADGVIARIVEAATAPTVRESRVRRTRAWLAPAFAAVGVAAVVLLVVSLVGLNTRARHRPGNSSSATQTNPTGPAGSVCLTVSDQSMSVSSTPIRGGRSARSRAVVGCAPRWHAPVTAA